jgi:hypothetical protein
MNAAWQALGDEIARWSDAGRPVEFWLRDDDAVSMNPALERLIEIRAPEIPLALAVVPKDADAGFLGQLPHGIDVLQHGFDHRNRAAFWEKKSEYPAREPVSAALARLEAGRARLAELARARFTAVLAPPWNRVPPRLLGHLPAAGFRGLSGFGARAAPEAAPGLPQVNTHVDVIAWRANRAFVGEDAALGVAAQALCARREGRADAREPLGWLTHHACHDEATWGFLARLLEFTRARPAVRWRRASDLFEASG